MIALLLSFLICVVYTTAVLQPLTHYMHVCNIAIFLQKERIFIPVSASGHLLLMVFQDFCVLFMFVVCSSSLIPQSNEVDMNLSNLCKKRDCWPVGYKANLIISSHAHICVYQDKTYKEICHALQ